MHLVRRGNDFTGGIIVMQRLCSRAGLLDVPRWVHVCAKYERMLHVLNGNEDMDRSQDCVQL